MPIPAYILWRISDGASEVNIALPVSTWDDAEYARVSAFHHHAAVTPATISSPVCGSTSVPQENLGLKSGRLWCRDVQMRGLPWSKMYTVRMYIGESSYYDFRFCWLRGARIGEVRRRTKYSRDIYQ
jgi:hypothetical protein